MLRGSRFQMLRGKVRAAATRLRGAMSPGLKMVSLVAVPKSKAKVEPLIEVMERETDRLMLPQCVFGSSIWNPSAMAAAKRS